MSLRLLPALCMMHVELVSARPLLCHRCCPGRHIRLCLSLAVTSTRHLQWHGVLVINCFVIALSCDCDSIIEANKSDRATSDVAMRTRRGILKGQHTLYRTSPPCQRVIQYSPPEKKQIKRTSAPCDVEMWQHPPNANKIADKDSMLNSLKGNHTLHQRETAQTTSIKDEVLTKS